ncbi:MAG: hypothetical protein NTW21_22635 [Verrucomicrobia bacterium]|nr:hypothetical protein [Verrucomicrobiota bacterium]
MFGTCWQPHYRYARRLGRSVPEAEGLVQGFFAKLLEQNGLRLAERDIKPENLLLDRDERVKVADSGLARIVASCATCVPTRLWWKATSRPLDAPDRVRFKGWAWFISSGKPAMAGAISRCEIHPLAHRGRNTWPI